MELKLNSDVSHKENLFRLDNFPKAAKFINAVLSQKYRVISYGGSIRGGKAQPLDADIITPFGIRKMRDIKVGNQISNPDGTVSKVIAVYPQGIKDIYRIEFVDKTSVECCGEHLWNYHKAMHRIKAKRQYGLWKTATTLQIKEMLKINSVSIPITKPVKFTRGKTMPIDPYIIGLILGDGGLTTGYVNFSTNDKEIIDYLSSRTNIKYRSGYDYYISDIEIREYLKRAGLMGCKSDTKFIPEIYKYAQVNDRWELVKGLMDTDGYMDERGHAEYVSVSKVMCNDMMFILRSLGFKVTQSEKETSFTYKGEKKKGKLAYCLYIQSDNNKELFKLSRKRKNAYQCRYERKKRIKSIEKIGRKRCVCISIDNPNGLYLTNDFNVTHNTFNAIASLILLHKAFPGSRSIIVRENLDILRKNTLPSCEKAIPSNFVRQFKGDPQFEWTFTNGSRMFFFAEGYEKDKEYDRWNGLEVNFILLEQVEELQKLALEKSLERIGSYVIPNGEQPQPLLIMTVNPTRTWAKELIYDKYMDGTLPEKWLYIPALLTDNPFIPDNFKEGLQELKRVNPVRYQRYVEGDWEVQDVIEGAFWKSFSYELHVKSLEIDLNLPLHISFDENVNPYPALSIWQVEGKNARQLHEICLRHPENKLIKVAKEFVKWARSNNWNNIVYIYGDATSQKEDAKLQAGYNYFTMLKNEIEPHFHCHIRKPSKNPPVAMSADFINSIFELNYDDINITINETCHESIKDYTTVQEAGDGTMIKKKTGGVELTGHFSDNFRYFICEIFKDSFRKYQRGTSVLDYTLAPVKQRAY